MCKKTEATALLAFFVVELVTKQMFALDLLPTGARLYRIWSS
jgi:hypothetical protein